MKNSNSLTNYSILVLVLLVLILIYIHIPNPPNIMRGGGSSNIENMIKNDGLYSNTLGHPIIQWVILVVFIILIYLAYQTSLTAFAWTGAPLLGINGLVDSYTISGPGFLKKFYQLTQDTLVLKNSVGSSKPLYPQDMETYKNGIVDFKKSMETQIKIFCNETIKCNICECPGVNDDPDVKSKCIPNPSNDKGGKQATALRKKNAEAADQFMGFIPKCCCLDKIIAGGYSYVTDPFEAQDFTNPALWEAELKTTKNNNEYKTYKWKGTGTDGETTLVRSGSGDSNVILNGCDVSRGILVERDSEGKIKKSENIVTDITKLSKPDNENDSTNNCTCEDNDPTLNYYNHNIKERTTKVLDSNGKVNISDIQKLKLKANLFAKWGALNEKSYRLKLTDPAVKLYDFPVSYYTDSEKKIFDSSCIDSDGYIFAGKKEDSGNIVCDISKWNDNDMKSNSKAAYMKDEHKYFYHLPNSTFSKPSLFVPSDDFKKTVEDQMKTINDNNSNTENDGFFGGIYNYMFSIKK